MKLINKIDFLINIINFIIKGYSSKDGLKLLLELDNRLYKLQGKWSIKYGNGIHTKHRHISYHKFFIDHIRPEEKILDIGCGNGLLSYEIATKIPKVNVMGIDLSKESIDFAINHYKSQNLQFILGDVLKKLPEENFDVIVLSNILEHINSRVVFLNKLKKTYKPKCFLIRVPIFERDWRVPLKKELNIDYRLDPTHFIEYTNESFMKELKAADLKIIYIEIRWGEIWSVVKSH